LREDRVHIPLEDDDGGILLPYPYDKLPCLTSHIHPKFAIFDAGEKLEALGELSSSQQELREVLSGNPGLEKIRILYSAWIRTPPKDSVNDISYNDPNFVLAYEPEDDGDDSDDPEDGDYTNRTKIGRGNGTYLRPRTRSVAAAERDDGGDYDNRTNRTKIGRGNGTFPRPRTRSVVAAERSRKAPVAVKRQKVLSGSSNHNQRLSKATLTRFNQQFGEAVWTGDRIRGWSKTSLKQLVSSRHSPIHRSSHLLS
jgi:hypothetical protein